jgi:hypothetical protein
MYKQVDERENYCSNCFRTSDLCICSPIKRPNGNYFKVIPISQGYKCPSCGILGLTRAFPGFGRSWEGCRCEGYGDPIKAKWEEIFVYQTEIEDEKGNYIACSDEFSTSQEAIEWGFSWDYPNNYDWDYEGDY